MKKRWLRNHLFFGRMGVSCFIEKTLFFERTFIDGG